MGILSNIFHKIFPSSHPAIAQAPQGTQVPPPSAPTAPVAATAPAGVVPAAETTAAPASVHLSEVDVEAILNDKAKQAGQALNWRTSIVDLLKLLELDSSLQSRKELAQELHYAGDTGDSAKMNIWLHRQVMNKLAENGGKVPADLKD
jgi:hypothetical protein